MPASPPPPSVAPVPRWGWFVATLVAVGLLVWSARRVDLGAVAGELARVRPGWLLLALAGYAFTIAIWTALWRSWAQSVRPTGWGAMAGVTLLLLLGANTLPFFGGHALGVALLVRSAGLPLAAALSILTVDQLLEGLAKVACLLTAAAVSPVAPWLTGALAVIGAGAALVLIGMRVAARLRRDGRGAEWILRFGRLGGFVRDWAGHLGVLRDGRRFALGLAVALTVKAGEAAALFCVQRALDVSLPLSHLPLVLCATQVAGMLPVSPGNLGVYEAAAMVTYAGLGVPDATALGLALLQHAAYLGVVIFPGLGLLVWRSLRRGAEAGR
mgnify:CR=1 FL=1